MQIDPFPIRRQTHIPSPALPTAPAVSVMARLAACNQCAWKVGDRCEHPAQGCAPCKQGRGLSAMIGTVGFRCPLKLF